MEQGSSSWCSPFFQQRLRHGFFLAEKSLGCDQNISSWKVNVSFATAFIKCTGIARSIWSDAGISRNTMVTPTHSHPLIRLVSPNNDESATKQQDCFFSFAWCSPSTFPQNNEGSSKKNHSLKIFMDFTDFIFPSFPHDPPFCCCPVRAPFGLNHNTASTQSTSGAKPTVEGTSWVTSRANQVSPHKTTGDNPESASRPFIHGSLTDPPKKKHLATWDLRSHWLGVVRSYWIFRWIWSSNCLFFWGWKTL